MFRTFLLKITTFSLAVLFKKALCLLSFTITLFISSVFASLWCQDYWEKGGGKWIFMLNFTRLNSFFRLRCACKTIVSSMVGPPPFLRKPPLPLSEYPPLSDANLKSYPSLSESHPDWLMQIVRNTLEWRRYVSYNTKSIENIINITLFTFRQLFKQLFKQLLVHDNTFSLGKWVCVWVWGGGGGVKRCWHNIKRGGCLVIMLDYKGGGGSRIWEKVIM